MKLGNASAAGVVSSLFAGVSLFLVFRIGIELVGATVLGSWILIQSAFILAKLPEAGVGINLTRLVAMERRRAGPIASRPYYLAGLVLSALPVFVFGLVIAAPVLWLMTRYFDSPLDHGTLEILIGLSVVIAVLNTAAAVALSILEGLGGLTRRHIATIASNLALAMSAYSLIATYGVIGIGLAYMAASAALCVAAILLLRWQNSGDRVEHDRSTTSVIKGLWRQNFVVSAMALIRMSFEPWTKFLVGFAGGLAAVAYVDLAFRVTTQIRVAVQAATQPLLSFGAREDGSQMGEASEGFALAHRLVVKANIFLIGLQIAAGAFVSYLGLGFVSGDFLLFYVLLAIGNSLNSLGVVGYYYDASGGHLRRLLSIHLQMMMLNVMLGATGGFLFCESGAVAAYALSFTFGGFALSRSWMQASGHRWGSVWAQEKFSIVIAVLMALCAAGMIWGPTAGWSNLAQATASAIVAAALSVTFVHRNRLLFR